MTGPSPWRLPSPRGGLTSVTVSGSTIEPVGSIILLPEPELQYYVDQKRQAKALHRTVTQNRGDAMNLTLVTAIVLVALWLVLVFGAHMGSGPVQLLYAAAVVLLARRIITGAAKFV